MTKKPHAEGVGLQRVPNNNTDSGFPKTLLATNAPTLQVSNATGKVVVSDALAESIFLLRLEAKPGTSPTRAIHQLRAFLKLSKRRFGLRCVCAREAEPR
jgi:hypothetical protein